jgi:hypothetical protein
MAVNLQLFKSYRDKIYVMGVVCAKSAAYYANISDTITTILLVVSSGLAVLNGIIDDQTAIKYINIALNTFLALLIGYNRAFKFAEKSSNFHKYSLNFLALEHDIEHKCTSPQAVTEEYFENIVKMYETYIDALHFSIPGKMIAKVKKELGNEYEYPLAMGGRPIEITQSSLDPLVQKQQSPVIPPMSIQTQPNRVFSQQGMAGLAGIRGEVVYSRA